MPIPGRDGGSIASYRLSQGLINDGHQLTLLAMNTSKHFIAQELWQPIARQLNMKVIDCPVDTHVNILAATHNLLFSRLPYNAVRFYSRDFKRELEKLLVAEEFDLIFIENLYPFLYLKTIQRLSGAKIIMRAHNIEHEIWKRTAEGSQGLKRIYLKILARRIKRLEVRFLNQYDYLAPITDRDREAFKSLGNTKPSKALPTGIITMDRKPALTPSENPAEVAHLGALDWAPNQEGILWFLTQVWPQVRAKIPTAVFHIAGRNAPAWFVKKINQPGVKYHGEINSAQDFLLHFPIHIVPLWSGSGMRIKIIEAMALGRVIITTPIGVEGIGARHQTEIIIEDHAPGFSNALINLIEKPEQLQQLSENAFNFVRDQFENSKLVKDFIRFIENEPIS